MNTSMQLTPSCSSFNKIITAFNNGRSLSCDQINYLRQYRAHINHPLADTLYRYFKIDDRRKISRRSNMKQRKLNPDQLKDEIATALHRKHSHTIAFTRKHYLQFRALLMNELIFLHGNHTLTGAPFFAGGVPHTQLFQWGNLFGIVKYEEILGETATDANILIHFEEKSDRTLAEILHDCEIKHEVENHATLSVRHR